MQWLDVLQSYEKVSSCLESDRLDGSVPENTGIAYKRILFWSFELQNKCSLVSPEELNLFFFEKLKFTSTSSPHQIHWRLNKALEARKCSLDLLLLIYFVLAESLDLKIKLVDSNYGIIRFKDQLGKSTYFNLSKKGSVVLPQDWTRISKKNNSTLGKDLIGQLDPSLFFLFLLKNLSQTTNLSMDQQIKVSSQILSYFPQATFTLLNRGLAYYKKQDWKNAFPDIKRYILLTESTPQAMNAMGVFKDLCKQLKKTEEYFSITRNWKKL
jgi:hypothetical protein